MANQHDRQKPQPDVNVDTGEVIVETTEIGFWKFGHKSGPPLARTGDEIPKQWQPPKNESTPSNRTKKE